MTSTDSRYSPATDPRPSSPLRRTAAIARAEARQLGRNRTALATALLMGPTMAAFLAMVNLGNDLSGGTFTTFVICMLITWCVLMAIYYNLTSIFVARREDGVFKRLSTGEATSWEALVAAAVPSAGIVLAQVALGGAAAILAFGMPSVTNPLLALVGLAGAMVVCTGLAAASTAITSSVEAAQYSTMPVFMILVFFSGTNFPLAAMPEMVQTIAALTPLNAASQLVSIGLNGSTLLGDRVDGFLGSFPAAGFPLLVLGGWVVASILLARHYMRFEPRR